MKKIVSAKEQWMNDMNDLRNKGYECDACCDGLGAIGENEFYAVYGGARDLYFSKVGETYTMIDVTDISEEYLLATNWDKLNPDDEWYDHAKVLQFLIDNANGKDVQSPIEMCDLIWMGIYPDNEGMITQYEDKEVEVSTEEIEAIRREITERCKGHSIEELRDMFDGYNWGEYGLDSFDFLYKGFVFTIKNNDEDGASGEWYLSGIVCNELGEDATSFNAINLPIPPKEIKVDVEPTPSEKPDLSSFKSCTNVSFDYMVERMRETCINLITDIYQKMGDKFVEIDTVKWLEAHGHFADYQDNYTVALTRNSEGDVVLTGTDTDEWDDYMTNYNWSFVSLEEMLYIINQLTSK